LFSELTQLCVTTVVEQPNRRHQERRGLGTAFGCLDRWAEQLIEGKTTEAPVQLDPSVDAPRHRHGANVVPERHLVVPVPTERLGVATGPGSTAGVEGVDPVAVVDEGEQIAAQSAQVRAGDSQHGVGGDCCVDGRAAQAQHRGSGRAGSPIG
jgi:hypothetical protein